MFKVRAKEIFIYANGSNHKVSPVNHLPVLLETQSGKFFMRYRTIKSTRNEPIKQKFREYQDIYSLFRSIRQAIEFSRKQRLPELENLNTIVQELNLELDAVDSNDKPAIERAKKLILTILEELKPVKTIELREAKEKTILITSLKDRLDRLNISASCARLVAVKNRLQERIKNIIGWLVYYAKWSEAVSIFLDFHERYLPCFYDWLNQLIESDVLRNSQNFKDQLTIKHLNGMLNKISGWEHFGGWRLWAMQSQKDLREAINLISQKKYATALIILKKVQQAVKLKLIQYQIHSLLLKVDIDLVHKLFYPNIYLKKIEEFFLALEKIDETGFRTPVKEKIFKLLAKTKGTLSQRDGLKSFLKFGKQALREAYRLI